MEVILQIITGVVVTFLSAVVLRMQDEAKNVQRQREIETKNVTMIFWRSKKACVLCLTTVLIRRMKDIRRRAICRWKNVINFTVFIMPTMRWAATVSAQT